MQCIPSLSVARAELPPPLETGNPPTTTDDRRTPVQPALAAQVRTLPSSTLLEGRREVLIAHEGQIYRLLQTKNGKLLLQK